MNSIQIHQEDFSFLKTGINISVQNLPLQQESGHDAIEWGFRVFDFR
jgi:hypothetical protein